MSKKNKVFMPLSDAVSEFASDDRISFHVPGHKGNGNEGGAAAGIFEKNILKCDLTELPGLDDLHHSSGVIRQAEQEASVLFGSDETFFLANGTTSGAAAAIAAVSSEKTNVILERSIHGCATTGLIISGASPYYIYDHYDSEKNLSGGISADDVKRSLELCENPSAVFVTHPSYYGTYSSLSEIVDAAHCAGVPVIADEAHGAQMMFTGQRIISAMEAGADISVQSTHKMLGSLTQSSMLHVQGNLVDRKRLKFFINMMTSTSPSYLLMSSLDAARADADRNGSEKWHKIRTLVSDAADRIDRIPGMRCCREFTGADGLKHDTEGSRLLVTACDLGLSGRDLEKILSEKYRIDAEFSDIRYAILLAGAGSRESDFDMLTAALSDISAHYSDKAPEPFHRFSRQMEMYDSLFKLRMSAELTPRQAVFSDYSILDSEKSEGRISACDISVYPPGIPAVRAGELLSRDIINYIVECSKLGFEFHGPAYYDIFGNVKFCCVEDERDDMMLMGYF